MELDPGLSAHLCEARLYNQASHKFAFAQVAFACNFNTVDELQCIEAPRLPSKTCPDKPFIHNSLGLLLLCIAVAYVLTSC